MDYKEKTPARPSFRLYFRPSFLLPVTYNKPADRLTGFYDTFYVISYKQLWSKCDLPENCLTTNRNVKDEK